MRQFFVTIVIAILTSLYFFPFNTIWLPFVNTKMALAAFAPILILLRGTEKRNAEVNLSLFVLSGFGLAVSIMGLIAVICNNTHDYSYVGYFVSMWVWIGGAYVVVKVMDWSYGQATFRILGNFLIAICIVQCLLAQIINQNSFVAEFVDGFMVSTGFMGKVENRLYGIGCALDVAGMKFAAILIIISYFCVFPNSKKHPNIERCLYMFSFFFISLFGNMISRTTTTGIILSFLLWITLYFHRGRKNVISVLKLLLMYLIIILPLLIFLYKTDIDFRANVRFAFEGFFSLAEQGSWNVKSNRQLVSMVVWPNNIKTWIIGDGYFQDPLKDFYYNGPAYRYYMDVDPGYCRFIFYFGILGLLAFCTFFVVATMICSKNQPQYAIVFFLILLLNFICWIKVSSDIFPVFALFSCLTPRLEKGILDISK